MSDEGNMQSATSDILGAEAFSPLEGSPLIFCSPQGVVTEAAKGGFIAIVDKTGELPDVNLAQCVAMVTTAPSAPAPWISLSDEQLDTQVARAAETAAKTPIATSVLARHLQMTERLDFEVILEMESLAYSTLLGGREFLGWLARNTHQAAAVTAIDPIAMDREDGCITLMLNSVANHNAMTAQMRDVLFEALVNALEDPSEPTVEIRANGRCFSTGGHLPEFGTAADLAAAHIIRTRRSCTRLLDRLSRRARVRAHGACIGSGIEIAAAADTVIAGRGFFAQLPELSMGLIPGAGGTASIARRIGRHRLMWMALTNMRVRAPIALDWGLIDRIEP